MLREKTQIGEPIFFLETNGIFGVTCGQGNIKSLYDKRDERKCVIETNNPNLPFILIFRSRVFNTMESLINGIQDVYDGRRQIATKKYQKDLDEISEDFLRTVGGISLSAREQLEYAEILHERKPDLLTSRTSLKHLNS